MRILNRQYEPCFSKRRGNENLLESDNNKNNFFLANWNSIIKGLEGKILIWIENFPNFWKALFIHFYSDNALPFIQSIILFLELPCGQPKLPFNFGHCVHMRFFTILTQSAASKWFFSCHNSILFFFFEVNASYSSFDFFFQ